MLFAALVLMLDACNGGDDKSAPVDDTDGPGALRFECDAGEEIEADLSGLIPVEVLECCGDVCAPVGYTVLQPGNVAVVPCSCDGLITIYYEG